VYKQQQEEQQQDAENPFLDPPFCTDNKKNNKMLKTLF
jgi:hypothetical protein